MIVYLFSILYVQQRLHVIIILSKIVCLDGFRGLEPVFELELHHTTCRLLMADDNWDVIVIPTMMKIGRVYVGLMYVSCGFSIAETLNIFLHGELAVYV